MNETIQMLLIICPLVFFAGVVDAVAGGGGLISLPAYLAAGLPPHMAIATNKVSSSCGTLVATLRFMLGRKIHYASALVSAAAALVGSYFGAQLNMMLEEKYLSYVLIVLLPVIAVFLLCKRDFGERDRAVELTKAKMLIYSVLAGLVVGCYDGFFGPGTGTFLILAYTGLIGFDLVTASGNAKVVNLAANAAALTTYAFSGKVVWFLGLTAALFGIAGNWIGSGLALKKGGKIIRPMFFVVLVLLLVKIIVDLIG